MTRTHFFSLRLLVPLAAAILGGTLLEGCSSATQIFYLNKHTQAIRRDSVTSTGVATTVQNPADAVNGTVNLVPVESLSLQPATINAPVGSPGPFDKPRTLEVPVGFMVDLVAAGLGQPQDIVVREDGTLFFSNMAAGEIVAIKPGGTPTTIAEGLQSPSGLELVNGALYYADEQHIYKFEFTSPTGIEGRSQLLTDKIPSGSLHYTRTLRWSPSDQKLYISIGSLNNKDVPESNEYGTVMRMSLNAARPEVASRGGLRNTMAMDIHPETKELWGIDQGTDWLSMDLPPDEVNIIRVGKHYGWPYFYSQNFRDPDYMEADTVSFPKNTEKPVIELQAHSAPWDMVFYPGGTFGADWKNAMLVTYHGSWNREPATGYKVVRLRANNDGSSARQADIVTGFMDENGSSWGRPTGIALGRDGVSFYITDDKAGAIYKVYKR